jgi:hypothetical protein
VRSTIAPRCVLASNAQPGPKGLRLRRFCILWGTSGTPLTVSSGVRCAEHYRTPLRPCQGRPAVPQSTQNCTPFIRFPPTSRSFRRRRLVTISSARGCPRSRFARPLGRRSSSLPFLWSLCTSIRAPGRLVLRFPMGGMRLLALGGARSRTVSSGITRGSSRSSGRWCMGSRRSRSRSRSLCPAGGDAVSAAQRRRARARAGGRVSHLRGGQDAALPAADLGRARGRGRLGAVSGVPARQRRRRGAGLAQPGPSNAKSWLGPDPSAWLVT